MLKLKKEVMKMKRKCFFTGHRGLGSDFDSEKAYYLLKILNEKHEIDTFVCGGAVGFDIAMGELVLRLKKEKSDVKLWLFLPCLDQDQRWNATDKARRQALIDNADYIDCPQIYYNSTVMKVRNYKMVDACDCGVAYFNGKRVSGTAQTLRYAKGQGKRLFNLAKEGAGAINEL